MMACSVSACQCPLIISKWSSAVRSLLTSFLVLFFYFVIGVVLDVVLGYILDLVLNIVFCNLEVWFWRRTRSDWHLYSSNKLTVWPVQASDTDNWLDGTSWRSFREQFSFMLTTFIGQRCDISLWLIALRMLLQYNCSTCHPIITWSTCPYHGFLSRRE